MLLCKPESFTMRECSIYDQIISGGSAHQMCTDSVQSEDWLWIVFYQLQIFSLLCLAGAFIHTWLVAQEASRSPADG